MYIKFDKNIPKLIKTCPISHALNTFYNHIILCLNDSVINSKKSSRVTLKLITKAQSFNHPND